MATGLNNTTPSYVYGFEPNVTVRSIATTGDVLDAATGYRMGGIPDGLGAYDNGNGTFTLLMNHELGSTVGVVRDHGAKGAYVSQWIIDKATLQVVSADDAIKSVLLFNDTTHAYEAAPAFAFSRFCSADLAPASAYQWTDTKGTATTADDVTYGTADRIFVSGEEFSFSGSNPVAGRAFGTVTTGADAGKAFELANFGQLAYENAVSSSFAQRATVTLETDDGTNGQVYIHVGEKQTTGSAVEKAGLTGGALYGIQVTDLGTQANNESDAKAADGSFKLIALGDVSALSGAALDAQSETLGVTSFQRPEDVSWDPTNPNVFYFVTTASFGGQSRLYQATLADIAHPELGGTIRAVLDSSQLPTNDDVGPRMMDNLTVADNGHVIIQEDVGGNAHLGRTFDYDPATDTLVTIAEHNPAQFLAGSAGFLTIDEENSGVIDVTAILGDATHQVFLATDQIHRGSADPELVETGQLQVITIETPHDGGNEDDTLNGDASANALSGNNGDDTIRGGSGNDVLHGNNGDDTLLGMADADTLYGDNGDDTLDGGAGNDLLIGGRGVDLLTGGAGSDSFDFTRLGGGKGGATGNDTITDFVRGTDHLVFSFDDGFKSQKQGDFNGDGITDTRLNLSAGGTVTLLGVSKIDASDIFHASSASFAGFDHDLSMMAHQMQIA